jgi:polyphosphate kinase
LHVDSVGKWFIAGAAPVIRMTRENELTKENVYTVDGPFNIPDLMQLYDLDRPDLKDRPLQLVTPPALRASENVFAAIKSQDIVLHHPQIA